MLAYLTQWTYDLDRMATTTPAPTQDEQPKPKKPSVVATAESEHFVAEHGVTVMAKSIEDAVKKVEATLKKRVGDV